MSNKRIMEILKSGNFTFHLSHDEREGHLIPIKVQSTEEYKDYLKNENAESCELETIKLVEFLIDALGGRAEGLPELKPIC